MKMYNKLYILGALLLFFSACTKNIEENNIETKRPAVVPAGMLFTNAIKVLSDNLSSASVNTNPWRFTVKHWGMTTYQDEARYDFATRGIPQAWWGAMYRDIIQDLRETSRVLESTPVLPGQEAVQQNKLAISEIMQVYGWYILVTTFGDVPYSQAFQPQEFSSPVYDDAATVYGNLLTRVTDAIGKLDVGAGSFSGKEDLIYGGKVASWLKFGNSLRLKMGMLLADSDEATAKQHVEAADAGAFSSADDNALFRYLAGGQPNSNPLYDDIVLGNRGDYVASKEIIDALKQDNDPRLTQFFKPNNAGAYVGGVVGTNNTLSDFAQPGERVYKSDAPGVYLDYVEIEFFRAEAKERGFNVAGTAEEHYKNAIKASVLFWGGTAAEADTYLAQTTVAYTTATGTWKEKIAYQKWLGLYNRPFDGWTELRRLDFPKLSLPVGAESGFPNRYTYPNNEQQLNGDNYSAASSKIGGDKVETKLFWDKN